MKRKQTQYNLFHLFLILMYIILRFYISVILKFTAQNNAILKKKKKVNRSVYLNKWQTQHNCFHLFLILMYKILLVYISIILKFTE